MEKDAIYKVIGFAGLLVAIALGMFYIGGVEACENGNGTFVSGFKCINTDQLIPVTTPEGNTVYVENDTRDFFPVEVS